MASKKDMTIEERILQALKSLQEYNDANPDKEKVLDVSVMKPNGAGITKIPIPKTDKSKKHGLKNSDVNWLYSDNLETYTLALQHYENGDYLALAEEYEREFGAGKTERDPPKTKTTTKPGVAPPRSGGGRTSKKEIPRANEQNDLGDTQEDHGQTLVKCLDAIHSAFSEIGPHESLASFIQILEQYLVAYRAIQEGGEPQN